MEAVDLDLRAELRDGVPHRDRQQLAHTLVRLQADLSGSSRSDR